MNLFLPDHHLPQFGGKIFFGLLVLRLQRVDLVSAVDPKFEFFLVALQRPGNAEAGSREAKFELILKRFLIVRKHVLGVFLNFRKVFFDFRRRNEKY